MECHIPHTAPSTIDRTLVTQPTATAVEIAITHLETGSGEVSDDNVPGCFKGRFSSSISLPRVEEAVEKVSAVVKVCRVRHELCGGWGKVSRRKIQIKQAIGRKD